ncbi:MAG: GDP-mannose 4,6-dehydratase [Desulfotignum sp.]|nr:GDP-mannose 4,6-dehydratase [Desulfobacteraceae bacterium]
MKKALIFGVSGQDGAFLARFLLEKNYRVIGASRGRPADVFDNLQRLQIRERLEMVSVSMEEADQVEAVIKAHAPDEVYNLSGQSSVARSFEIPGETYESVGTATLNLLEAARKLTLPVKIFNAGSGDCFGDTGGRPATENSPLHPVSPYGSAKVAALRHTDTYRQAHQMFACTGILFNHESWLRPERFVTQKIVATACSIARGRCHEMRLGNTAVIRDWGWAPEYVEAMWLMLQQPEPDDYIIATGTSISLEDFVDAAFSRLDLDWKKYVHTDPRFVRPADIGVMYADPSKAYRKLGWKARIAGRDVARQMVDARLSGKGI